MNIVQQFYDPTFMPEKLDLAEFIEVQDSPAIKQKIDKLIEKKPEIAQVAISS